MKIDRNIEPGDVMRCMGSQKFFTIRFSDCALKNKGNYIEIGSGACLVLIEKSAGASMQVHVLDSERLPDIARHVIYPIYSAICAHYGHGVRDAAPGAGLFPPCSAPGASLIDIGYDGSVAVYYTRDNGDKETRYFHPSREKGMDSAAGQVKGGAENV